MCEAAGVPFLLRSCPSSQLFISFLLVKTFHRRGKGLPYVFVGERVGLTAFASCLEIKKHAKLDESWKRSETLRYSSPSPPLPVVHLSRCSRGAKGAALLGCAGLLAHPLVESNAGQSAGSRARSHSAWDPAAGLSAGGREPILSLLFLYI